MRAVFVGFAFAILFFANAAAGDDAGSDAAVEDPIDVVARAQTANFAEKKKCEIELVAMGEAAVPALIVGSKKSATEAMRKWCEDTLDEMGKRTAADDVQTSSDEALIGVFGAFAQTKDVDALSAIFPFVGSDRIAIRTASRQALRDYGDAANARIRAEYINLGGQIPTNVSPSTAQLLDGYFEIRDRLRLADVTALFEKGLAEAKTDVPAAITDLDAALAREPLLDRRKEAAPIYVQYAHDLSKGDRRAAREYDLKAMRIAEAGSPDIDRAASEIAFFDAEDLRAKGIIDRNGYAHAVTLDPENQSAQDALASIDAARDERESRLKKMEAAAAASIAVTALFAAALIAFLRRRRS
jgi:hypothetical protein